MDKRDIPTPPKDYKIIDIIIRGKDTRIQIGGYIHEIEELKDQLVKMEKRVVKVGRNTIVVPEVAAVIE